MIKTEHPKKIGKKEESFTVQMSKEEQNNFNLFKGLQDKRSQENSKYLADRNIKHSKWEIRQREANIKFKEEQIANGKILETMSLKNEKTGLNHGFIDQLKPVWFLKTEIELMQMEIEDFEYRIKQTNLATKENKDVFTA